MTNLDEALEAAQNVDTIILCIGEDTYTETPGNIDTLMLGESQFKLASALAALNKPIVLVYVGGRPRTITQIEQDASTAATLIAFLPGNRGAEAIADIIYGRTNPSGKLPITYPKSPNGITTYDYLPIEAAWPNSYEYLYPFGHGLSFTTFEYSSLTLSVTELVAPNNLTVSFVVRNVGDRDGKEVVMVYLNDVYGSVPRPVRQLKKYDKVELRVGEARKVSFDLRMEDLRFVNAKSKRVFEEGTFNVYVANLTASFILKDPKHLGEL